jgi:acetyl-CoA synthetase
VRLALFCRTVSRPSPSLPAQGAKARLARCAELHRESLRDPESFWLREAAALSWMRPPQRAFEGELVQGDVSWFGDGMLNATVSWVDRHAAAAPERPALVWLRAEGDVQVVSYRELRQQMCGLANVLLAHGIRRSDRVVLYLPLGAPLLAAALACARIGAVHLAISPRATPDVLRRALRVVHARLLVTANEAEVERGRERIPLWEQADEALGGLGRVEAVLVHRRTRSRVPLAYARDHDLERALGQVRPTCPPAPVAGEDPLLLALPLDSDGGQLLVHAAAGFLLQALLVQREVLGVGPQSRVLCLSDLAGGRIDVAYGTLALGGALVLDERGDGVERLEAVGVTHVVARSADLAVAPTRDRTPLSVALDEAAAGAQADLEAVWSSEAAGMLFARWTSAGATPLFGIDPVLLDTRGAPAQPGVEAELCTRASWPSQPRTLEADHARFVEQRLHRPPGLYRSGERCRLLADGTPAWVGRVPEEKPLMLSSLGEPQFPTGLHGRA